VRKRERERQEERVMKSRKVIGSQQMLLGMVRTKAVDGDRDRDREKEGDREGAMTISL